MSGFNFQRYQSETTDADGTPLVWPGGPEGYPFRGKSPPKLLRDEEYEKLKLSGKFRCRTFYLNDDKDRKDYELIRDKCSNNYYAQLDRVREWDEEKKTYRIYLEWLEIAYEGPAGVPDVIQEYTKPKKTDNLQKLAGIHKGGAAW
jgi:hypothetical protein